MNLTSSISISRKEHSAPIGFIEVHAVTVAVVGHLVGGFREARLVVGAPLALLIHQTLARAESTEPRLRRLVQIVVRLPDGDVVDLSDAAGYLLVGSLGLRLQNLIDKVPNP